MNDLFILTSAMAESNRSAIRFPDIQFDPVLSTPL